MRVRARIDDNPVRPLARAVDEVNERAFVVALQRAQLMLGAQVFAELLLNFFERHVPVDGRLARAK